jgi:methyl-accepting chemotaxis protein
VTQGNAASAEQTSSAADELSGQARLLQDAVEHLHALIASTSRSQGGDVGGEKQSAAARPVARQAVPSVAVAAADRQVATARRRGPHIAMPDDVRRQSVADDDARFRNF